MKRESNPVVLAASDLNDMVQAIRTLLEKVSNPKSFSFLSNSGKPTGSIKTSNASKNTPTAPS
ncbi:hypothetical protein [Marinomonas spartinae]|uniref:hypothetical protein n=1 Tax=Marinomonas spartinae TaxID=1792290 RepID=UPI0011125C4F|nr:hypothetical protein [Marinomonas spartinae]